MAHVVSNYYAGSFTQLGGGVTEFTTTVDVGTGTNRAAILTFERRNDRVTSISSITIGGEAAALVGADVVTPSAANRSSRSAILLNPTVTGSQTIVILGPTNGVNSDIRLIVSVYDDVDPTADPADLLILDDTDSVLTPWTGPMVFDVASVTGHEAVMTMLGTSNDLSATMTPSDYTAHVNAASVGAYRLAGSRAGAATATFSTDFSGMAQDFSCVLFGFSLPPPGDDAVELDGAIASVSALTGNLVLTQALGGESSSVSAQAGALALLMGLTGSQASASALSGALAVIVNARATSTSVSALEARMAIEQALTGQSESYSELAAELTLAADLLLSGAIVSASELRGSAVLDLVMRGRTISESEFAAVVRIAKGMRGNIRSESEMVAALAVEIALTGSSRSESELRGDLAIAVLQIIKRAGLRDLTSSRALGDLTKKPGIRNH